MLVLSSDSNKMCDEKRATSLEDAVRALPDCVKLLLPQHLLAKVTNCIHIASCARDFYRVGLKTIFIFANFCNFYQYSFAFIVVSVMKLDAN